MWCFGIADSSYLVGFVWADKTIVWYVPSCILLSVEKYFCNVAFFQVCLNALIVFFVLLRFPLKSVDKMIQMIQGLWPVVWQTAVVFPEKSHFIASICLSHACCVNYLVGKQYFWIIWLGFGLQWHCLCFPPMKNLFVEVIVLFGAIAAKQSSMSMMHWMLCFAVIQYCMRSRNSPTKFEKTRAWCWRWSLFHSDWWDKVNVVLSNQQCDLEIFQSWHIDMFKVVILSGNVSRVLPQFWQINVFHNIYLFEIVTLVVFQIWNFCWRCVTSFCVCSVCFFQDRLLTCFFLKA